MKNTFNAKMTIQGIVYNLVGVITRTGPRLFGTLSFTDGKTTPIDFKLTQSAGQMKLYSTRALRFILPSGKSVEVPVISSVNPRGVYSEDPVSITLTAPITVDLVAATLDLVCSVKGEEPVRINEIEEVQAIEEHKRLTVKEVPINQTTSRLEHYSMLLGAPRIDGETSYDLARRLTRVSKLMASTTALGALESISNQLGIKRTTEMIVKKATAISFNRSRIVSRPGIVRIYSIWYDEYEQEMGAIPVLFGELRTNGMNVGQVADWINLSGIYKVTNVKDYNKSFRRISQFDSYRVHKEKVQPQEITRLSKKNIVPGSVYIADGLSLTEVSINDFDTTKDSLYTLNYDDGVLYRSTPGSVGDVAYIYIDEYIRVESADVQLIDVSDELSRWNYFERLERNRYSSERERYKIGLPTTEGYELLYDIFQEMSNQYWRE